MPIRMQGEAAAGKGCVAPIQRARGLLKRLSVGFLSKCGESADLPMAIHPPKHGVRVREQRRLEISPQLLALLHVQIPTVAP